MSRIFDAYCSSLRDLGWGEPLWEPEPGPQGQIECGDVGYITEGRFIRLFRATCPADDPINGSGGVPDGFSVLNIPENMILTNDNIIAPQPICSRSVKGSALSAGPQLHGVSVGYQFTCHSHIGAVLIPQGVIQSKRIEPNDIFRRYTAENYKAWHAFACKSGRLVHETDIFLVSGHVKTVAWVLAAFMEQGVTHSVYLSAQGVGVVEAEVGSFRQTSVIQRNGPRRTTLSGTLNVTEQVSNEACDQCLFLRYYKAASRFPWGPLRKIVAAAEPLDDNFFDDTEGGTACSTEDSQLSHDDGDPMVIVTEVPSPRQNNQRENPVYHLLSYILRNSDADTAVASHDDISTIWLNDWPENLSASLDDSRPRITLDDNRVGYIILVEGHDENNSLSTARAESRKVTADKKHLTNTHHLELDATKMSLTPLLQVAYSALSEPHAPTDAGYIPFVEDSPQPGIRLSDARNPQVLTRPPLPCPSEEHLNFTPPSSMDVPLSQVPYRAANRTHAPTDAGYIPFFLQDSPQPGIRLSDARNPQVLTRLQRRREPVPIDCRAKASIRIQPTGYKAFSKQKYFRRAVGGQHTSIDHEKVVQLVADVVREFIREAQLMVAVPPGAVRFGAGYIELDRIVLLGLRRVSFSSFQPELAILPNAHEKAPSLTPQDASEASQVEPVFATASQKADEAIPPSIIVRNTY